MLVVGCSDSRVDPAIITDCRPGDLFVVRNVANLIPPYEPDTRYHGVSAAIEYAICFLNVEHVIVLGHSHCGGIDALMQCSDDNVVGEFIGRWVAISRPARDAVQRDLKHKSRELQRIVDNDPTNVQWISSIKELVETLNIPKLNKIIEEGDDDNDENDSNEYDDPEKECDDDDDVVEKDVVACWNCNNYNRETHICNEDNAEEEPNEPGCNAFEYKI